MTSFPRIALALSGALALAGLAAPPAARAQSDPGPSQASIDMGRQQYLWHCASCHGDTGTGNGEMRKWLAIKPADLTTISKRNGGVFPHELMWEVIDGRATVKGHGTREMPVWGQWYRDEAMTNTVTARSPEWAVRNRIVQLLDYLSRIQQK